MESKKVVHLSFKNEASDTKDFYFGSMAAIYTRFGPDDIGIKYTSLRNVLSKNVRYENTKVVIQIGVLQRKKKEYLMTKL